MRHDHKEEFCLLHDKNEAKIVLCFPPNDLSAAMLSNKANAICKLIGSEQAGFHCQSNL